MLDVILAELEERGGVIVDVDGGDLVALLDGIDDVLAIGHLAEDRMFAIRVRSGNVVTKNWGPLVPAPRWPWRARRANGGGAPVRTYQATCIRGLRCPFPWDRRLAA